MITSTELDNNVGYQAHNKMTIRIRELWNQVYSQIEDQVTYQVEGQITNQLEDILWIRVWDQVGSEVKYQVEKELDGRTFYENEIGRENI